MVEFIINSTASRKDFSSLPNSYTPHGTPYPFKLLSKEDFSGFFKEYFILHCFV
jgi:hypothetical protein